MSVSAYQTPTELLNVNNPLISFEGKRVVCVCAILLSKVQYAWKGRNSLFGAQYTFTFWHKKLRNHKNKWNDMMHVD